MMIPTSWRYAMIVTLLLVLTSVNGIPVDTRFFFPQSCSTSTRECCPSANGDVCSGSTRGLCRTAFEGEDAFCDSSRDDAISWATHFFDKFCLCEGNYYGIACEDCAPGWTGDDCTIALPLNIRRNVQGLNTSELATVVEAFALMRTMPHPFWPELSVWAWVTSLHSWAKQPISDDGDYASKDMDFAHRGPSLAVWHRTYQWQLERYMQIALGDDTFTIPYWDWSNSTIAGSSEDVALQLIGGDGDPDSLLHDGVYCHLQPYPLTFPYCNCTVTTGPFAGWPAYDYWGNVTWSEEIGDIPIQRAFNCSSAGGLPDAGNVESLLLMSDFDEMYPTLEGKHGRIHSYIGWTMYRGSPPSDPIFWLHHSFIDLILERWLRRTDSLGLLSMDNIQPVNTTSIGHGRDECSVPQFPLRRNSAWMKPSWSFGYTFDYFTQHNTDGDYVEPLVTTQYEMAGDPAVAVSALEIKRATNVMKAIKTKKATVVAMSVTSTTTTTIAAGDSTPEITVSDILVANNNVNKKSTTSLKKALSTSTSRKLHAISSLGRLRGALEMMQLDDETDSPIFDTQAQQRENQIAARSFVHVQQPGDEFPVHDAHPPVPPDQQSVASISSSSSSTIDVSAGDSGDATESSSTTEYGAPIEFIDDRIVVIDGEVLVVDDLDDGANKQPGEGADDTSDLTIATRRSRVDRKSRVHHGDISAEAAALSMATEIDLNADAMLGASSRKRGEEEVAVQRQQRDALVRLQVDASSSSSSLPISGITTEYSGASSPPPPSTTTEYGSTVAMSTDLFIVADESSTPPPPSTEYGSLITSGEYSGTVITSGGLFVVVAAQSSSSSPAISGAAPSSYGGEIADNPASHDDNDALFFIAEPSASLSSPPPPSSTTTEYGSTVSTNDALFFKFTEQASSSTPAAAPAPPSSAEYGASTDLFFAEPSSAPAPPSSSPPPSSISSITRSSSVEYGSAVSEIALFLKIAGEEASSSLAASSSPPSSASLLPSASEYGGAVTDILITEEASSVAVSSPPPPSSSSVTTEYGSTIVAASDELFIVAESSSSPPPPTSSSTTTEYGAMVR